MVVVDVASAGTKAGGQGGASSQLAGIPSLVWDVAGSAETSGTPGSGSTTMGVASPTMGGNIERTVGPRTAYLWAGAVPFGGTEAAPG